MSVPMTPADRRREAILVLLAERAGKSPDAKAIAQVTADIWQEVESPLVPVIGAKGVGVLFDRALHQTGMAFPWLRMAEDHGSIVAALDTLRTCLAGQQETLATEASHSLLMNFTQLLATLIGEHLTERLLGSIWTRPVTGV